MTFDRLGTNRNKGFSQEVFVSERLRNRSLYVDLSLAKAQFMPTVYSASRIW
jgi:hypothetical protein